MCEVDSLTQLGFLGKKPEKPAILLGSKSKKILDRAASKELVHGQLFDELPVSSIGCKCEGGVVGEAGNCSGGGTRDETELVGFEKLSCELWRGGHYAWD